MSLKPISLDDMRQPDPRTQEVDLSDLSSQIESAGYHSVQSNAPCPEPGWEDGTVYCQHDGHDAIWSNGILYIKD